VDYELIVKQEEIDDALKEFRRRLGLDPKSQVTHKNHGFKAKRVSATEGREVVQLSLVGNSQCLWISVRPQAPLSGTKGLVVTDERRRRYIAHSGLFGGNFSRNELFDANTRRDADTGRDVEWINVTGDIKNERYLITPIDEIDDTDLLKNVARFVRKRFVHSPEDTPMVVHGRRRNRPSLNRILYGPPGTGKTFDAVSEAVQAIDGTADDDREQLKDRFNRLRKEGRVEFVTFHQNYAYEDFIEGIRPVLDRKKLRYELRYGIFKQIAKRAKTRTTATSLSSTRSIAATSLRFSAN